MELEQSLQHTKPDSKKRRSWLSGYKKRGHERAYLANIDVRAFGVNVRVVGQEQGRVNAKDRADIVTSITALDDISRRTIFTLGSKTDRGIGREVGAGRVNHTTINRSELVSGCIVCGRDAVANITVDNSVCTSAIGGIDS